MTNENTENPGKGKKPSHLVYVVTNYGENNRESKWDAAGAAWEHKDGRGFNIELKLFPVSGKLTLRPRPDQEENAS